jgi:hypothetical protein
MGQYYRGVILTPDKENVIASVCPYTHNNGSKLMEHSYVGNWYVQCYEQMLSKLYFGNVFVWVGDYADNNVLYDKANKYIESYAQNNAADCKWILGNDIEAYYEKFDYIENPKFNYIVNLDKKQYVKIPQYNKGEWIIHPLPLLCADGNGRGGGDYHRGSDMDKVGIWAYDRIGVLDKLTDAYNDFTELVVEFKEEY